MDAVAVEAAALAGGDGAPVSPGGVGVAVGLPLRASVVEVLLAVAVGGHVAGVDSHLSSHVRVVLAQRSGERVEAAREDFPLCAELASEPVAGPMRWSATESRFESGMLRDQVGYARPRRQGIEGLDETGS